MFFEELVEQHRVHQCADCDLVRAFIRQIRRQCCLTRVFDFRGVCAVCFSRWPAYCANRNDLLGNRNERPRITVPSNANRVIPAEKRGTAFGLFDTGYGIAWFLGSAAMGLLYDKSILAVVLFSVLLQIAALPVLYIANKSR